MLCTPYTFTSGRSVLMAKATPDMSPPPPIGTITGLHFGHLLEYFESDGALAGYYLGVVEGVHEAVAVFLLQFYGARVGVVVHAGHEAYFGAVALGGLYFGYGGACGQADERLYAVVGGAEGYALRVVSGGAGYHAACFFLVGELRYLVVCATELERACELQVLGFEVDFRFRIDFRSRYDGGLAGHVLQNGGSIEYFAYFEHTRRCVNDVCFSS